MDKSSHRVVENIKIVRVVSVTNEIEGHSMEAMVLGDQDSSRSWLCEKGSTESSAILQLERSTFLVSVRIVNAHSAHVRISVGKSADPANEFVALVPSRRLMSERESDSGDNATCTTLFDKSDFNSRTTGEAWDLIKVVCCQPFNKRVPYGLSLIEVKGEREKVSPLPKSTHGLRIAKGVREEEGEGTKNELQIGSFFKKKRSSEADKQDTGKDSSGGKKEAASSSSSVRDQVRQELDKRDLRLEVTSSENKKPDKERRSPKRETKNKASDVYPTGKKRKGDGEGKTTKSKKKKERGRLGKPFENLLEGVVLVISGFQNPLRGNLRNLALDMGARYSPNWEDRCTHLVCACPNTPKFNQVNGRGKIVKKEWLERCHADRKRYPWRRFALNEKDTKAPESEEEIEAETEPPRVGICKTEETSLPSGDNESPTRSSIEQQHQPSTSQGQVPTGRKSEGNLSPGEPGVYDMSTDEDEQEKEVDTTDYPMPYLPDFLSGKIFFVDLGLKSKSLIERYIVAYKGVVSDSLNKSVEFYVTNTGGSFLYAMRKKFPDVVAVRPTWLTEMNSEQRLTSFKGHLVK